MSRAPDRVHIAVAWGNPTTQPPPDAETLDDGRTLWACTLLDRGDEKQIRETYAPKVQPGSGWCHWWTSAPLPVKRWSGERKAAMRRRNLRKRLEKSVPLFADQFEADELARRPAYFDPVAIDAEASQRAE